MRKLPEDLKVSIEPKVRDDIITQTRQYSLITPLFGGGVEPNTRDLVTVVRATSVRGHLRFWWRACRAGKFSNLGEMKAYEDALWGSAAKEDSGGPSQVVVQITEWEEGNPDKPFIVEGTKEKPKLKSRPGTKVPEYAAFPLQPRREDQTPGMPILPVFTDVRFTLQISFPSNSRSDIEAALWAWETFGGIGARTRRGFGALRLEKVDGQPHTDLPPANTSQAQDWLNSKLREMVETGRFPKNVPHLSLETHCYIVRQNKDGKALVEWEELINKFKQFRQRRYKQEDDENKHGHSGWPEPNTIRRVFEKDSRGPFADRSIDKFPRAQFGLPIIFHMAHDRSIGDVTLQGQEKDRLASPLILKPLACQGNKALGLALILEGVNLPEPLVLKEKSREVSVKLTPDEAKRIVPLRDDPLKVETDVLQAFLNYLKRR